MEIIVGLLLAFVAGFICALKSVQLGLRWQIQTKEGNEPTIEIKTPVVVKPKEETKDSQEQAKILDEWLNGER